MQFMCTDLKNAGTKCSALYIVMEALLIKKYFVETPLFTK
jgi:hypothetical protein